MARRETIALSDAPSAMHLPRWKVLLFSMLPTLALLAVGELAARIGHAPLCFGSYRELRLDMARRGYPAVRDSLLGYVPEAGYESSGNQWGTHVTIDSEGFRSNGESGAALAGAPILVVGDSFTFGDEVDDEDTWPAHLERLLGRPVKNGGVFGYSLGQSVLRAEESLKRVPAEWLIVSFISSDITRCEYSKRYAPKPYFEIVDDRLVVHPPPESGTGLTPADLRQQRIKNLLGHSALLDVILSRVAQQWWYMDERTVRVHPKGKGIELAKLLVERIAEFSSRRDVELLLVAQGSKPKKRVTSVLDHARGQGVQVLDLIERIQEEKRDDPAVVDRYFARHMTPAGNRWVAEQIAEYVRTHEIPHASVDPTR